MHDGKTRRVARTDGALPPSWQKRHQASLVLLSGPAAGFEYELDATRVLIGRGEAARIRLDDLSISSEHAAVELQTDGFAIRDLASTNGVRVNGAEALSCELKHGDEVAVGAVLFQYVVTPRRRDTRWDLETD